MSRKAMILMALMLAAATAATAATALAGEKEKRRLPVSQQVSSATHAANDVSQRTRIKNLRIIRSTDVIGFKAPVRR